jgi:hypothetical protein
MSTHINFSNPLSHVIKLRATYLEKLQSLILNQSNIER